MASIIPINKGIPYKNHAAQSIHISGVLKYHGVLKLQVDVSDKLSIPIPSFFCANTKTLWTVLISAQVILSDIQCKYRIDRLCSWNNLAACHLKSRVPQQIDLPRVRSQM